MLTEGVINADEEAWSPDSVLDVRRSASRLTGTGSTLPEWRIGVVQYWSAKSKVLYSN